MIDLDRYEADLWAVEAAQAEAHEAADAVYEALTDAYLAWQVGADSGALARGHGWAVAAAKRLDALQLVAARSDVERARLLDRSAQLRAAFVELGLARMGSVEAALAEVGATRG